MPTEKEKKLLADRIEKLELLRKQGVDPYPSDSGRTHMIAQVLAEFSEFEQMKKEVALSGRIMAIREHGGIIFGNMEDGSGNIQFMLREEELGDAKLKTFLDLFDIGDFVELPGILTLTKRGEKTLVGSDYRMLAKSLRALPEKWHGLTDVETKLRKRYLDLLVNHDLREVFEKKSIFWKSLREFLQSKGFLEVELPVLEQVTGGAEAEPFVTHYNAMEQDFYLRISLELPLKKLLVGGFERVFEIGRIFRNEGVSTEHLQDYTQLEFYYAYANFEDLKILATELYRKVIKAVMGTHKITNQGVTLDWSQPWHTYDYYEQFEKFTSLDLHKASDNDLRKLAKKLKLPVEKFAQKGRLIDLIYKKAVRPNLVEPGFLVYPPLEIEPLAKRWKEDESRVQRLQVVAWGTELGKGFAELNDPLDQRKRFEEQMKLREAGDKEAQQMDDDYLEAMEYGMPPMAGFGLSERLFAVLLDKSIRETVFFPPMRSEKKTL